MPKYQIPKSPGEFHIRDSYAGSPMIWNGKESKGKIIIPCRDLDHANKVLEMIRSMKNGGEIWV